MKQKMRIAMLLVLFLVGMFVPGKVWATSSSGGYTIEAYHIDMKVNEDNTFDITEKIRANFTGLGKHGIFRKIPLRNTVERVDGTSSNNLAKISNVYISEDYSAYNENGYKVFKIGDKNRTVSGKKEYTIQYTYNIGKDPLKEADELYFNLIGGEWDTNIKNVTFTITMPKEFDASKLGFSSGIRGSTNSSKVQYTVNGNTIQGYMTDTLFWGEALTVRLTLPEGYFVGAITNIDYKTILEIALPILFVLITYRIWKKYGKDDMVVDTVEFYPPDGLNSTDIAFLYKGSVDKTDVISLLIYLANKGYLKIEEEEQTVLKLIKSKSFKIIKLKEYDGDNEDEKTFFNELFAWSSVITKSDLQDKFYKTLDKIARHINRKSNKEKIFEKASLKLRAVVFVMIVIIFICMGGYAVFQVGGIGTIFVIVVLIISSLVGVDKRVNVVSIAFVSIMLIGVPFFLKVMPTLQDPFQLGIFIIQSICMVFMVLFLGIMQKRNPYGIEMLGRVRGFKKFLEIAEKPKLEELVMEDPEYFYNILPYTYVLGVSDKWMKKFEDIALKEPEWYGGSVAFNVCAFESFMNSTYSSISNAMSSSPSSSGSGGGFSGGGSGGGGGGSW